MKFLKESIESKQNKEIIKFKEILDKDLGRFDFGFDEHKCLILIDPETNEKVSLDIYGLILPEYRAVLNDLLSGVYDNDVAESLVTKSGIRRLKRK